MSRVWGTNFSAYINKGLSIIKLRVDDISEDLEEEAEKAIASLSSNENDNTQESTSSASPSSSTQQRSPSPPTTEELMAVCHAFVDQLRNGTAPWVVQRLNNTFGPMPSDVSSFSFWMAQVSRANARSIDWTN